MIIIIISDKEACCGMLWHVVACCGMLWHVVACCGMLWHVYLTSDRHVFCFVFFPCGFVCSFLTSLQRMLSCFLSAAELNLQKTCYCSSWQAPVVLYTYEWSPFSAEASRTLHSQKALMSEQQGASFWRSVLFCSSMRGLHAG